MRYNVSTFFTAIWKPKPDIPVTNS